MLPITKERKQNTGVFRLCYDDLCRLHNLVPLPGVKAHLTKNTLDFNGDRIKLEEWGPILTALGLDRTLHFIAVRSRHPSKCALEDVDTEEKARAVVKRPVLLTRYILYTLVRALSECLSKSTVLTCLELEGLPLAIDCLSCLCEGITQCKSLQNISFYRSLIEDEGCKKLCMIIRNLPNIISLDLSKCGVTYVGALCIAEMLKYQGLQRYTESWKQTLRYRTADVESMPGLRRITLNHNYQIGDEGVMHLIEAVREDLWLRVLDLQNCGVGETGGLNVLEMLNMNNSLHIVDLRGNRGVDENLLRQIMCKLAHNNTNSTHEYQWISLDPQLLRRDSSTTLASRPSFYSCKSAKPSLRHCNFKCPRSTLSRSTFHRGVKPSLRQPKFNPPAAPFSRPTINRTPSASCKDKSITKSKPGTALKVDLRMNQQRELSVSKPVTAHPGPNGDTGCLAPVVSIISPTSSHIEELMTLKLETLVEQLVKEVSLRKEAEIQQEELRFEVQRLAKELEKEQEEKEGFCLLKVEAFEAIQRTLDKFVAFMKNVKQAQALSDRSQENDESENDDTDFPLSKNSDSNHVKRTISHREKKIFNSTSEVFSAEALDQSIQTKIKDCVSDCAVLEAKTNRLGKKSFRSGLFNSRRDKMDTVSKLGTHSYRPKIQRSVPLISMKVNRESGRSTELNKSLGPRMKVHELLEDIVLEPTENKKEENFKYIKKINTKPLIVPSVSVKRHSKHFSNYFTLKSGSQSEEDESSSTCSKSSTIHSRYSTEDDTC